MIQIGAIIVEKNNTKTTLTVSTFYSQEETQLDTLVEIIEKIIAILCNNCSKNNHVHMRIPFLPVRIQHFNSQQTTLPSSKRL